MTTSFRNVSAILAATLVLALAPANLLAQDNLTPVPDDAAKKAEAARLIEVLRSDAATFDKAKACQRLALIGTKDAVPALAALLADENLGNYARFGLERIADAGVDDALRDALGKLHGPLLVGVINSVGVRRDAKAVGALARLVGDPTPEVAPKALAALAEIATAEAVEALQRALAADSAAVRAAAAEASLVGADRLVAQGKREEAAGLCDAARGADVPVYLRAAATRGAILARQSAGVPLLLEQLKSGDEEMFGMALRTSRELPGSDATQSLVAELEQLPPARQVLVIRAIGDRQDAAALPAMRKLAAGGTQEVRSAAMHVLGQLGDASAVTVLLDAVVAGDPALAEAARASLMQLRGSSAEELIVTKMDHAAPGPRVVLLDLIGQLAIPSATGAVLKMADDPDEKVRLAAIKTLGRIGGLTEFAVLTDRLLAAQSPQETAALEEALKVACLRMPDPDATVAKLQERLPDAPIAAKCFLIELTGSVGGARALEAVSAAAEQPNEDLQDAATQALGKWTTPDAAPALLKLAKTLPSEKLKVRSLRGYIRIAQQMGLPPAEKLQMCEEALAAAQRDEERRLVLGVLGQIPTAKAMSLVVPHLAKPALAEEAATAALAIGEKIIQTQPRVVADAMREVLKSGAKTDQAKKLLQRAGS
ncbi:MAG: HEAT repeat domain-containing protein [Rhodopirellula sp.]|nr:HEAT repeat domain-containing protein [Rhodopirellula sp.]